MSGQGEDPKIKISVTFFVNGERRRVLYYSRFLPVGRGFPVYCSNKPKRLGVRRRLTSRRISDSSSVEKKERSTTRRRSIIKTNLLDVFCDREQVFKKGSKSWSTLACDCLDKETKTFTPSDNSNEPELRARGDEATARRCIMEKLLHLRQRCTCSVVAVDQSAYSGIVSQWGTCTSSCGWAKNRKTGCERLPGWHRVSWVA